MLSDVDITRIFLTFPTIVKSITPFSAKRAFTKSVRNKNSADIVSSLLKNKDLLKLLHRKDLQSALSWTNGEQKALIKGALRQSSWLVRLLHF